MASLDLNGRDKPDSNGRERLSEDNDEVDTDGVTIIIHEKQEKTSLDEKDEENMRNISTCHIITGCLTILLQIATVIGTRLMYVVFEGVVTGFLFILTGCVGLYYLKKKKNTCLTFFLILSIFDALACVVLLAFASIRVSQTIFLSAYNTIYSYDAIFKTLACLEIIISLVQGVTSITGSTICCKVYCCIGNSPRRAHYKDRTIQVLSGCQIGIGIIFFLCFFLNHFLIRTISIYDEIWCGIVFIVIGSIGLLSVNRFYKLVTPFLMLNIIGCLFAVVVITLTGFRMSDMNNSEYYQIRQYKDDLQFLRSEHYNCTSQARDFKFEIDPLDRPPIEENIRKCEDDRIEKIKGLEDTLNEIREHGTKFDDYYTILVVQLILALLEVVILLTTAGLVCHVCCCCCAASQQLDTTAVYIPARKLESGEAVVHVSRQRPNHQAAIDDKESRNYSRLK